MPDDDGLGQTRDFHGIPYEEMLTRVYRTAIHQGAPTLARLREQHVEGELQLALPELVARGFLTPGDRPGHWDVVPPRLAFARWSEQVEHRSALSRATAGEIETAWRRALGRGAPVVGMPEMDLLSGIQDIVDRVVALHRAANRRLWWALEPSVASGDLLARLSAEPDLLSVRHGVAVQLIVDTALIPDERAMALARRCEEAGHDVRFANGLPFSFLVCDDASALLDLSQFDEEGDGSIEVRSRPAVRAVERLFEEAFSLSTPFRATQEAAGRTTGTLAPLDDRDQRILSMLTVGATDQVIARQVGVSVRTVERRVRYLMEHLGSATRFQAGVQAVRRNWV